MLEILLDQFRVILQILNQFSMILLKSASGSPAGIWPCLKVHIFYWRSHNCKFTTKKKERRWMWRLKELKPGWCSQQFYRTNHTHRFNHMLPVATMLIAFHNQPLWQHFSHSTENTEQCMCVNQMIDKYFTFNETCQLYSFLSHGLIWVWAFDHSNKDKIQFVEFYRCRKLVHDHLSIDYVHLALIYRYIHACIYILVWKSVCPFLIFFLHVRHT